VLTRGYKWTSIAQSLPRGRSADAVRNRWHRLKIKASNDNARGPRGGIVRRGASSGRAPVEARLRRGDGNGEGDEASDAEEDEAAGSDASSGETVEAEPPAGIALPEERHGDMCALPCPPCLYMRFSQEPDGQFAVA